MGELLELLQKHKSQYFPLLDESHVQFTHNNRIEEGDAAEEVDLTKIPGPPPMGAEQSEAPIRLTLDTTPDFLHLPLDFQGFGVQGCATCPREPSSWRCPVQRTLLRFCDGESD